MKKTDTESLVKNVVALQEDMNSLTVDAIAKTPVEEPAPIVELTAKQRAAEMGIRYIEPKRKLPALGKLPEKLQAQHKYDWEYVKGIYENYVVNGEPLSFWMAAYPGDPDYLWEIPANVVVYVPRFIAKHLEDCQKYHTFSHREKSVSEQRVDDFQYNFAATGTHYRGKFRAIGAFA
jgi:hypothetical protein